MQDLYINVTGAKKTQKLPGAQRVYHHTVKYTPTPRSIAQVTVCVLHFSMFCFNLAIYLPPQSKKCLEQISLSDRVLCLHTAWNILFAGLANGSVASYDLKVILMLTILLLRVVAIYLCFDMKKKHSCCNLGLF